MHLQIEFALHKLEEKCMYRFNIGSLISTSMLIGAIGFSNVASAAICKEPGKFDADHALSVSNIWKEVTTKTEAEYQAISLCLSLIHI